MSKSNIEKYKNKLEKIKAKQEYLDSCNKLTFGTYTKRLVAIIIAFCFINIELSYVLAFLGKEPLIDITNQLIVTILGTAVVYIIRAFFDTWSENKYGDGNKIMMDELNSKIDALEENSGFETIITPCSNTNESETEELDDDNYGN